MKRKYLIMIISTIVVIAIIAIGTICFPYYRRQKMRYNYTRMKSEASKAFEEMVIFCEENQDELEAYSSRYLAMKNPDMSHEERKKLEKQIEEELDCKWIFEEISVSYPKRVKDMDDVIVYKYKKFEYFDYEYQVIRSSIIEIFYVEEEMEQQEFEEMYSEEVYVYSPYDGLDESKKINEHLYVCMSEW